MFALEELFLLLFLGDRNSPEGGFLLFADRFMLFVGGVVVDEGVCVGVWRCSFPE